MREFCPLGECPGYVGKSLLDFIYEADVRATQSALQEIQQGGATQFRARLLRTILADDGMTVQSEYTWQTVKVTNESRNKRTVFLMFELADNCRQQFKGTGTSQSAGTDGMSSFFNCAPALTRPIGAMHDPLPFISRQPTAQDLLRQACNQRFLFNFPGATPSLTPEVPSHLSMFTKAKDGVLGGAPLIPGQPDAAAAAAASLQQANLPRQHQHGFTNIGNNINDNNLLQMLITQNALKDLQASQGQVSAAEVGQQLLQHQQQQLFHKINLMEAQQQAAQQQQVQARLQLQAAFSMKSQPPFTAWPVNAETPWRTSESR